MRLTLLGLLAALLLATPQHPLSANQVGRDWGIEQTSYTDPATGVVVRELTAPGSAADNLYFHFSNFTADDRYLVFVSNRTNGWQIYRAEVATGRIHQLTDDPQVNARTACPDPTDSGRLYYLRGPEVRLLTLNPLEDRRIGEIPAPRIGGFQQPTLSHDGRWLTLTKQRDPTTWEIGRMDVQTGEYRPVITQGFRIGHVQHSPTEPLIFYVWETGGYAPQRTWLVNPDGSGNRPFYFRTDPQTWFTPLKEWVTHEAWVPKTGRMTMIVDQVGVLEVDPDGTSRMLSEGDYWHAAARPDGKVLVIDDNRGRLWLLEAATGNKRLLAAGLRDTVRTVHAHASFDRRGRWVQFHTGRAHETVALVHLANLPEPKWDQGAGE